MRWKILKYKFFNQKGEIAFLGIILVLMSLSLWTLIILKNFIELKDLKQRTQKHLCFKYLYTQTNDYHKKIASLNKIIKSAYYISLIPATRVQAQTTMKVTQTAQSIIHVSYMKNLLSYPACSLTAPLVFIKNIPYLRANALSWIFKRNFDGTTKLKTTEWNFTYYLYPNFSLEERVKVSFKMVNSSHPPKSSYSHLMSPEFRLFRQQFGLRSF
jgi:hypothetical protein